MSINDGTATPLNQDVYAPAMQELGYEILDINGKTQIGKVVQV